MKHLRHFITIGERQLHFRHAGEGPPLILLHACPKSSVEQAPLVDRLSGKFSVYAFDIPGYGDSDPVPHERPEISDFAIDLASALDRLGIDTCSIYGRHTGGLIALEFADRFPKRLNSAIFDGFPLFSDEERRRFLSGYLQPLMPLWDGLHLPGLWARMRENYLFFPWHEGADPGHRNDLSMPPAAQLHATAIDILKVMDRWRVGYASAFRYRPQAALARISCPTLIMARRDDLLFPHLERVPDLPEAISIEPHSFDVETWAARIETFFRDTASGPKAPALPDTAPLVDRPWSTFAGEAATRLRLRRTGSGQAGTLILHDVPGSSELEAPLMHGLLGTSDAVAPDLPGVGLSRAGDLDTEGLIQALAAIGSNHLKPEMTLVARGLSAGLAIELARRAGTTGRLVLIRPLFIADEKSDFSGRYVAAHAPDDEGTHLTKLWYAARDNELYWPWFARNRECIRSGERRLEPTYLNAKVVAMAENMPGYTALVHAVAGLELKARPPRRDPFSTIILMDDDEIGRAMAKHAEKIVSGSSKSIAIGPSTESELEQLRKLV